MPRKTRQESPTGIYHWISRGIHRKKIFHRQEDFRYFLGLVKDLKVIYSQKIHHYCLMDNHVHMLVYSPSLENLSLFSHFLARKYAYYYCGQYKWIGPLFQGRYKGIPVDDEKYLLECGRYIERNPIKAQLALRAQDYPYSSFQEYAGDTESGVVDPSPAYLALDDRQEVRQRMYEHYVNTDRIENTKKARELKLV
ncbi:MAG: hypothetical protein MOGMAGMI_02161 [Candidatus Omnitrophica bacterium]|nr:hypothetical protein [Candidatus Omnitrophota bacterium]